MQGKKHKQEIILEIRALDDKSEQRQLGEMEWKKRYQLEDELLIIYAAEELYWQKRGGGEMASERRF